MSKIKVLDGATISKIAAGEVVERPSAIIKELFENAVDAGSTEITVEIEGGGKDLIKVSDNGSGIEKDDVIAAFERHSTSKISSIADVYALHTMGFRGEALHSIAAVAKVKLLTKTAQAESGYEVEMMGGELKRSEEAPALDGTTVEVTDLFYNTPVRWKFLKTTTQERRASIDIMNKLAIANASISVTFKSDGELVFKTDGRNIIKNTVMQVYGRNIAEGLESLDFEVDGVRISGLSSKFSLRKRNRNFIMTFVNGRYVKSTELQRTIEGNYRAHLMGGEFPVSFVFVEINPSEIDVNVHPSKTEIKFSDYKQVERALKTALKMLFDMHAHIPNVSQSKGFSHRFGSTRTDAEGRIDVKKVRNTFGKENVSFGEIGVEKEPVEKVLERDSGDNVGNNPFRETEYSKETVESTESLENEMDASINKSGIYQDDFNRVKPDMVRENHVYESYEGKTQSFLEGKGTRFDFSDVRIIGIFDTTFILGEYDGELYIFDQHAAHEKVLFEEYKKAFREGNVHSQMLLMPFEIRVEKGVEMLDLKALGFETEPFGLDTIVVRSVPAGMDEAFAREFLEHVIETGEIDRHSDPFKTATKSCRAAIMSGDALMDVEVEELMRRLTKLEDPYNCPHGRPIIIKLSRKEIDKMFRRIL